MGEAATLPEAVPQETAQEARPARRFRIPRLRREPSTDPQPEADLTDEATAPEPEEALPLAYQTFSPKLAPALTALGGLVAALGGLGMWVRAVSVEAEGLAPEQIASTYGYNDPEGLTIAVFGAVAALTSWAWLRQLPLFKVVPSLVLKLVPALTSGAVVGLVAWQLPLIDQEASRLAQEAIANASFLSFHAGLGWGAWCMTAGAVALFIGTVIGILREIDLKRRAA